ncbi:MAG TPA: IS4 family transposase [Gemmataceae bacterium]|nr:IS4 family transposase [Gemmataceae bacterium]
MAAREKSKINVQDLKGFKYFKLLTPLLERLHDVGTANDTAGNRKLFFDQYAALLLFYFFNPALTSLRGVQQAATLDKVQKRLGVQPTSLGSLSAAARVFDAEALQDIVHELAEHIPAGVPTTELQALQGLTAVDGSLLPALPRMAWALWVDDEHRAAKMHLAFEVLRGIPTRVTVTAGNASEHDQLRALLQPERLYVIDRGYAEYQLFQDIIDAQSGFVGRIRDNAVWQTVEERPVSDAARAAGVRSDRIIWLGGDASGAVFKQPLRVVEVVTDKRDAHGRPEVLLLATDQLDLDAELVALAYRFRWSVELFFRWFKCILGCQHLLSTCPNGVAIQVYLAVIASLLVSLWTGQKPTKRTFEMLCFYFSGWASEAERFAHLEKVRQAKKNEVR